MINYKPKRKDIIRVNIILWLLFFTLGFATSQAVAQVSTTVPKIGVDTFGCTYNTANWNIYPRVTSNAECEAIHTSSYASFNDPFYTTTVYADWYLDGSRWRKTWYQTDPYGSRYLNLYVGTSAIEEMRCPESHPIDNGDGTCSAPPPQDISDCPIGTKPSTLLGNGWSPECIPFTCPTGGANVSIPTAFFEVDFGTPSFSYCDGSCAYSVQSGSGGDVNAWGSGMACGNGTPEYVYAVPTFDDASCTSGDGWVDCSDNPQKVDEDNPPPSEPPATPDDIGVPMEDEPDFISDALPDCTAETALSGSCFVNSMDAVQGNIVGGINAEQSQQTDRIVKALVETMNGKVVS